MRLSLLLLLTHHSRHLQLPHFFTPSLKPTFFTNFHHRGFTSSIGLPPRAITRTVSWEQPRFLAFPIFSVFWYRALDYAGSSSALSKYFVSYRIILRTCLSPLTTLPISMWRCGMRSEWTCSDVLYLSAAVNYYCFCFVANLCVVAVFIMYCILFIYSTVHV